MNDLDLRALVPLTIGLVVAGLTVALALTDALRVRRAHAKLDHASRRPRKPPEH
ncbi:hypothetical protein [Leifsonia shinshuensis]|uniref:Uncharacterized protein n=1 Tax=Leifsonia shinshuensis TaxID=150026 RepID=A0A853D3B3_9MICO|nr:hypothetical protein [Leifsonia shinshuensis]NYJ25921.1 hypothetical protein [Leifsonia shinshuensis]